MTRQALGGTQPPVPSQSQSQSQTAGVKAQGLTYLVAQHKRAEILQCEGVIKGTMTLRPTGMQSETHRMLVRAVGQKHSKIARLRMAPDPTTDPEREKIELAKQAAKKPRKSHRDDDDLGGSKHRRQTYSRKRAGDDMWSDDDDDDIGFGGASEDEFGLSGSVDRKGKKRDGESSKRGPGEYQNDDFLVADSDDEDADFVLSDDGAKRKKSRRHREEEPEEDDLERAEAKLEASLKKQHVEEARDESSTAGGKDVVEEAMDVESEEDDEDWGVRRAGTGSRKRRAIDFEDDEEE